MTTLSIADELIGLLPHRSPLRLLETQIQRTGDRVRCRGRIPDGAPTAADGVCSPLLGLELAAQAAICLLLPEGQRPPVTAKPRVGYLVRIRDAQIHAAALPVECPLIVDLELRGRQGGLNLFTLRVALEERPDDVLVEGQISTFETDQELPPTAE